MFFFSTLKKTKIIADRALQYCLEAARSVKDKRKRFAFTNFMPESSNWFESFLFNACLPMPSDWRLSSFKPDLEYFSVFGDRNKIRKSKTPIKIFWTGEDTQHNFSEYADNCIDECNISLGFDYINAANYVRYPLWLLYYFGFSLDKDNIARKIQQFNEKNQLGAPDKFCAMIARHDRNKIRKQIIDIVSDIKTVACAGAMYHNDDTLNSVYNDDKIAYLKQFKFTICPENVSVPGIHYRKAVSSL